MKSTFTTKKIVGAGIFTAIVIIIQLISNYVSFGPVSISLALIPIAIGAMLYGPLVGAWLGLVMGAIVLTAPTTLAFSQFSFIGTVFVVLLKSSMAGLVSGLIYKLFKNKNETLGIILASIIIPIVNTGIFALGVMTIFLPLMKQWADGTNAIKFIFIGVIGWNFFLELAVVALLTPTIKYTMKISKTI